MAIRIAATLDACSYETRTHARTDVLIPHTTAGGRSPRLG
jgi:hypothetical protein